MRILITGGKSVQSLKLLKDYEQDIIVLADYGDMPSFPSKQYKFISLGERNDDTIAHNLLNHCLDEEVDAIIPLHVFEREQVLKSVVLFEEFNVRVLMPALDQVIS